MKKAKLIGYYVTSEHKDAETNKYQDHDEGNISYHFVVELDKEYYVFDAVDEYGSCGSGYTSATWANINNTLCIYTGDIDHLTKPIKEIFLNVHSLQIQIIEKDQSQSWDPTITQILTTDKELLVSSTGNGGCSYYPSGILTFNNDLFK